MFDMRMTGGGYYCTQEVNHNHTPLMKRSRELAVNNRYTVALSLNVIAYWTQMRCSVAFISSVGLIVHPRSLTFVRSNLGNKCGSGALNLSEKACTQLPCFFRVLVWSWSDASTRALCYI